MPPHINTPISTSAPAHANISFWPHMLRRVDK